MNFITITTCPVRRRDQLWVSDATGVLTRQGWLYLVAVLDVFTRRVIGWGMSPILMPHWSFAALRMALSYADPLTPSSSTPTGVASLPALLIASSSPNMVSSLP